MHASTRVWVEGTIMAALAMVLSFIPIDIGPSFSVNLGQAVIAVYALRRGTKAGLLAALVWGLLYFPTGKVWYLSVPQVLIEYPIAFTFAGFTGVASAKLQQAIATGDHKTAQVQIIYGVLVGAVARYFWHFVAGWIFWGQYAMWGLSPVIYSIVMNAASGLATAVAAVIILLIFYRIFPSIFVPKNQNTF